MNNMRVLALALLLFACAPATRCETPEAKYDPLIVTTLLDLLKVQDATRPPQSDFTNTSLKDLIVLGTPEGYYLRSRYLDLGISLSQDLAVAADDKRLNDELVEAARWERNPDIRSAALIAMAARRQPDSKRYLDEALNNPQPEIRFAALEALQVWGQPEAKDLYVRAVRSDREAIIRIYAAQALAKMGDPLGLETLRNELQSGSWLACAMAARYLGDVGTGDDYDLVLDRMVREQTNDFVKAETAIAALKLFPKKSP